MRMSVNNLPPMPLPPRSAPVVATVTEDDGSRVLTWENFFLGGDTDVPVNAQIRLSPNGDFTTRSNDVESDDLNSEDVCPTPDDIIRENLV